MTEPGFACRRRETKPSVSRCGCAREWSARPTFSAFVKHCGFTTWVTKLAPMARYGRGLALSGAGRGRRGRGRAADLLCRVTLQLPLAASPVAQLGRPAAGGEDHVVEGAEPVAGVDVEAAGLDLVDRGHVGVAGEHQLQR